MEDKCSEGDSTAEGKEKMDDMGMREWHKCRNMKEFEDESDSEESEEGCFPDSVGKTEEGECD